ncbi:MAG: SDR family NAD(P)-dependent oxidoreductase, partial [Roseovarius sp.]|nr:SDR family NAD(P)-dependent oxidoreductase [Roseovarius sp.]
MTERSILITGCSSGIGYNAAHGLRARGWRVFAACRKEPDCERLRAEGFESPRIDYTDESSIQRAVAEVLAATGGRLDALFNNGA